MPELNHKFHQGKMNKDLDERLVPNGEYKDALNIEVGTSEGSNVGSMQTIMGNVNLSNFDREDFYCVGSIVNEKEDKIYWLISGDNIDIIAEYSYKTKRVVPVVVDLFTAGTLPGNESGRVLNFDKTLLITGINIIDDMLFWTDNYTEPKRINITRCKMGSIDFQTQTQLYIRDVTTGATPSLNYINSNKPLKHEHITVIKKSPPAAPVLEMQSTRRGDENLNYISGEISTTINIDNPNPLQDTTTGGFIDPFRLYLYEDPLPSGWLWTWGSHEKMRFSTPVDYKTGDRLILETSSSTKIYEVRIKLENLVTGNIVNGVDQGDYFKCKITSGDPSLVNEFGVFNVKLEQEQSLFRFKFPRFATRYKYEDGEYSAFSPFTDVAFLPGEFDYLPKEGYNLGMVNNLRFLAVKDFVDERLIPDDVISMDILYKESDSPSVYTVKSIKRANPDLSGFNRVYDEWNAIDGTTTLLNVGSIDSNYKSKGYLEITSEMIHAVLPSNQLLRPYDNVPKKALAQEITGNRIVYGNYLQNYNLSNRNEVTTNALTDSIGNYGYTFAPEENININILAQLKTQTIGNVTPAEYNADYAFQTGGATYGPAKSIKTLRTYQLGVVYIDEYGRETPVFSDSNSNRNSIYVEKASADKSNRLAVQNTHPHPEWAKSFKFFVKETSSEYYNLSMDRWYDAQDGNIWLTFPSSERNKVDLETFLILKKEHDTDVFVTDDTRYKILAIENEAPLFVKTEKKLLSSLIDSGSTVATQLIGSAAANLDDFPLPGNNAVAFDQQAFEQLGWATPPTVGGAVTGTQGDFFLQSYDEFQMRFKSDDGFSNYYDVSGVTYLATGHYKVFFSKTFGVDMSITTLISTATTTSHVHQNVEAQLFRKVILDRPEYDGRFFAKIKKDLTIIDSIIHPNLIASDQFFQSIHKRVQYINFAEQQNDTNNGGSDDRKHYSWYNIYPFEDEHYLISTSYHSGIANGGRASVGAEGKGGHYWKKASANDPDTTTAGVNPKSSSSGWFIDKIEGFRAFNSDLKYFNKGQNDWKATYTNTYDASNGTSYLIATLDQADQIHNGIGSILPALYGVTQADRDAWLDGYTQQGAPLVEGTNTYPFAPNKYLHIDTVASPRYALVRDYVKSLTAPNNDGLTGANIGFPAETEYASPSSSGIIPSVGIQQGIIHLSHSGIGFEGNQEDWVSAGSWTWGGLDTGYAIWDQMFTTWANQHADDTEFISTISQPGCMWTWREDPGKCVYVTKQYNSNSDPTGFFLDDDSGNYTNGGNPIEISDGLWARNSRELYEEIGGYQEIGIGLYNHVEISDYYRALAEIYPDDTVGITGVSSSTNQYQHRSNSENATNAWGAGNMMMGGEEPSVGYNPLTQADGRKMIAGSLCALSWMSLVPLGTPSNFGTNGNQAPSDWPDASSCGAWDEIMTGWVEKPFVSSGQATDTHDSPFGPTDYHYDGYVDPLGNIHLPTGEKYGKWPMKTKYWWAPHNKRRRYQIYAESLARGPVTDPGVLPNGHYMLGKAPASADAVNPGHFHNYLPTNDPHLHPHWFVDGSGTVSVLEVGNGLPDEDAPGIRPDGMHTGYPQPGQNDPNVTIPDKYTTNSQTLNAGSFSDIPGSVTFVILTTFANLAGDERLQSRNPGIWETEPKETVGLDIYNEVGQIYPINLNLNNVEQFIGPVGKNTVENSKVLIWRPQPSSWVSISSGVIGGNGSDIRVYRVSNNETCITLSDVDGNILDLASASPLQIGDRIIFTRADGSKTETNIIGVNEDKNGNAEICLDPYVHNYQAVLPWHNCYSFGNGVESDRIRDDFNQVTIDNGPKASTTIDEPYLEERRASGLIYSGIYNSTSGVNNLNQFIAAEKITKDLNPIYGSIQKLHTRNTNLLTLCEDKVFKILANKDALFNADGSVNLTATENVLGQATPLLGEYGISTNPESFASESYRNYFTDKTRGAVIRLSQDGLTPISDVGMRDYFADSLKNVNRIYGSIDDKKQEYNITLDYKDDRSYNARIIGDKQGTPTSTIVVSSGLADIFEVGDLVNGSGIEIGSTVVSITNVSDPTYGDNLHILLSKSPSFVLSSATSPYIYPTVTWDTIINVIKINNLSNTTISFSEITKGWTSFKSWLQEDGVSLNSEYYTFKEGDIWKHHQDIVPRNSFYGEQYDSSVELLFNEIPGSVKSFQTLNYEGSQSKITPPVNPATGEIIDGEYWDNELKEGWYVSKMYTDMQQADRHEFKDKEGKWFSQIQGVATEWLNDGTAGNIDTNEFSYQGIDESNGITTISGGYTSWDCAEVTAVACSDNKNRILVGNIPELVVDGVDLSGNPSLYFIHIMRWLVDNAPAHIFDDYAFKICSNINISTCIVVSFSETTGINGGHFTANDVLSGLEQNPNTSGLGIQIGSPGSVLVSSLTAYWYQYADSNSCYLNSTTNIHRCLELSNQDGPYFSESDCLNDPSTVCGGIPESYNCNNVSGGGCVDPGNGTGAYADLATCLLDCNPCTDPIVSITTTDATTTTSGGLGICQADGTIRIDAVVMGTTWEYLIEDAITGVGVASDIGFASGTQATFMFLTEGSYNLIITDNLGCTITESFVINCVVSHVACVNTGPYDTQQGSGTSPHDITVTVVDATNTACDNGSAAIQIGTLGAGASSIMVINLWDPNVGANNPHVLINQDINVYPPVSSSVFVNNLNATAPAPSRPYYFEVIDDLGCSYYYDVVVRCNNLDPTYDCAGEHGIYDSANNIMLPPYACYDPVNIGLTGPGYYTNTLALANNYIDALTMCQDECQGCPSSIPDDGVFSWNNTINISSAGCATAGTQGTGGNGSITVRMNASINYSTFTLPTSWQIAYGYEDNSGIDQGIFYSDPATYNIASIVPVNAAPLNNLSGASLAASTGMYYYTITTDDGCSFGPYYFEINCVEIGIPGCTDPTALNYDPLATIDDGSCIYPSIQSCANSMVVDFNSFSPNVFTASSTWYPSSTSGFLHEAVANNFTPQSVTWRGLSWDDGNYQLLQLSPPGQTGSPYYVGPTVNPHINSNGNLEMGWGTHSSSVGYTNQTRENITAVTLDISNLVDGQTYQLEITVESVNDPNGNPSTFFSNTTTGGLLHINDFAVNNFGIWDSNSASNITCNPFFIGLMASTPTYPLVTTETFTANNVPGGSPRTLTIHMHQSTAQEKAIIEISKICIYQQLAGVAPPTNNNGQSSGSMMLGGGGSGGSGGGGY